MNKKIVTVLLALAMIISMVPVAVGAECGHTNTIANPNWNGTHDVYCRDCETWYIQNAACDKGVCSVCGASEPSCQHEASKRQYDSNNNGTHIVFCATALDGCGARLTDTEACQYNENGVCIYCYYQKPAEEPKCDHTYVYTSWTCNNNGTHTAKCECGEYVETVDCTFKPGSDICQFCGYDRSKVEEPEKEVCDCGVGNGEYALPVDATHHNICCEHNKVVNGPLACTFNHGVCVCGNKDPNFKGECHHHNVTDPKRKDDATHTGYCSKCGRYVEEEHTYVDGWCACGAQDPHHHEHHKPAKPTVSDSNLDSVPKTGSMFLEWLYALIFG